MNKVDMKLPDPLGADWVYDDAIVYEQALAAHAEQYGWTPEHYSRLGLSASSRCAYRTAVDWISDGIERWPEVGHAVMGMNARIMLLQAAIHCGAHEKANAVIRELAEMPEIILPENADPLAYSFRGTGIQPGVKELLARFLQVLKPASVWTEPFAVMERDFDSNCELASAVKLISIGNGCYGWLQPNRYMLRYAEPQECLAPFNMSVFPINGMIAALSDGMAGFEDENEYAVGSIYRSVPMVRHKRYSALFNHECDDFFLKDNAAELREFYAQRGRNFLDRQCKGARVYICIQSDFSRLDDVELALATLMQDDDYRLLFISFQAGPTPEMPVRKLTTTRLAHIPYPAADYNWTLGDGTLAGVRYDLTMRATIRNTMLEVYNS